MLVDGFGKRGRNAELSARQIFSRLAGGTAGAFDARNPQAAIRDNLCPIRVQVTIREHGACERVRVIARKTLKRFVDSLAGTSARSAVQGALDAWYKEARRAAWESPADVLRSYGNASIVGAERVVFNIKGNDYRLVVAIKYEDQIVFIKWIGTHAEYDRIDVKTVKYER